MTYMYILFLGLFFHAEGQVLGDQETIELLKGGTQAIYNMNFNDSHEYIEKLEKRLPNHPVVPLMHAYEIYWKNIPMSSDSKAGREYKQYLDQAVERADQLLEEKPDDPEAIFYALSAHSLLTKFYGDEHQFTKTMRAARKAYQYLKDGFDMNEEYPEFYFYTGLYNFYRERYPQSHPVIKPFIWVFKDGSIEKGIEELKLAAEQGMITSPESYKYLCIIYLKYMFQPGYALKYSEELNKRYPQNYYFKSLYVENLVELSEYDRAIPHIELLLKNNNKLYKMTGEVFKGLYYEKEKGDMGMAEQYYISAENSSKNLPWNAKNYLSFAYAGLARISINRGNHELAKEYYKKAKEFAQYDKVQMEADAYLKQ